MKIEKLGLRFSNNLVPFRQAITKIVCHHPAHPSWTIQDIHNYHRGSLKWSGIGYNYFITRGGRIQEGRGRNQGAHVSGHNHNTLGICFQGNFETQQMTDDQVKSGAHLIVKLLRDEGLSITDVIGHRDLAKTACPGRNFRIDDLKQEILEILNPSVKKERVKKESDDTLQFTSPAAKKQFEDRVKWMVANGHANKIWVERIEQGTIKNGDAIALTMMYIDATK